MAWVALSPGLERGQGQGQRERPLARQVLAPQMVLPTVPQALLVGQPLGLGHGAVQPGTVRAIARGRCAGHHG